MRKINILVSTFVLAAMLLAACGAEATSTSVPGTDVPMTEEVTPTSEMTTGTVEAPSGTETVNPTESTTPGIPVTGEENPSRLSNQLDYNVWNQNGEQIGEVNDMVLDLDNAAVSYVIVGTGGFLEIGEKDVLVPWDKLELQTNASDNTGSETNAFVLQADQQTFEDAPDTDVNSILPGLGEPANDWDADIRSYWEGGVTPSTPSSDETAMPETTSTVSPDTTATTEGTTITNNLGLQGVALASDLLDSQITLGMEGVGMATAMPANTPEPAGTAMPAGTADAGDATPDTYSLEPLQEVFIDDAIVDIDTGDIQYVIVDTTFDDGEHWIPVPLNMFQWDATNQKFILDTDATVLQDAPFFQDGQYPDMTVQGWDDEFSTYWDNNSMVQ